MELEMLLGGSTSGLSIFLPIQGFVFCLRNLRLQPNLEKHFLSVSKKFMSRNLNLK